MGELPTGTVTFLFTDIEGSTRLLDELGDRYGEALEAHRRLVRDACAAHGGQVVDTQGDAFFVSFATAPQAVAASVAAQRALAGHDWPEGRPVRVRMGLHSGTPETSGGAYVGMDVHRGARIAGAANGGQVLLSTSTRHLLGDELPDGLGVRDLGEHRLKDLTSQRLFQLVIPGLENQFPALRTLENHPTNLPTQPTPLIGRRREIEQAGGLLGRPDVRLLTLTGPGGTGKTRLALQLGAERSDAFHDGVFFVNLTPIADPELVLPAIAQTLAVRQAGGESFESSIADHLRGRRLLLLLDNFEQVLPAGPAVAGLLNAAPDLKILVTSRAPLRVTAEHEFSVPPLDLPDVRHLPETEALTQYEAVALFIERARSARPGFTVTNENARAVAETCVRLDGLPLAIELAAAQIRVLTPQALHRRLQHRLNLLTGGARDAPARQQTLRAAIDWSYELLTDTQQWLFTRLSVFAGGCDLEAAEAVCGTVVIDVGDVLSAIASLVENSLLVKEEDQRGEPRYAMLESIHEYASEKLRESSDADAVRRRHAEHYLDLAQRADRVMRGEDPFGSDEPDERIKLEIPNLRSAMSWAVEAADWWFALRLAAAAYWAWGLSVRLTEGRAWLESVLEATPHLRGDDRARALLGISGMALEQGDISAAGSMAEQALALAEVHGKPMTLASALSAVAVSIAAEGDPDRARPLAARATRITDQIGNDFVRALDRSSRAALEDAAGNHEEALRLIEEALTLLRAAGVPRRHWIGTLTNIGWEALQLHDYVRAREVLEEVLSDSTSLDDGQLLPAQSNLGLVSLFEFDLESAGSSFRESLLGGSRAGVKPVISEGLYAVAAIAALDGDHVSASRLRAAADRLREGMGIPLTKPEQTIIQRYLDPAEAAIAEEDRSKARSEGTSMTMDEAVEAALALLDARARPVAPTSFSSGPDM